MDKQESVNTNHETISKSVKQVDSHVHNLIFDAPDATPYEIETLNRLNTINSNFANYNPASLKLSQFRILYAMPADVSNFISNVLMMDKNNELDTNNYSYGRNAIIARLRDFIRSYNDHIRLVNAGYNITEPTVDDCIKYIFEWNYISWNRNNSIKFEENLTLDDFKFIIRLTKMSIMRKHSIIAGYNAYNVLIGLHRRGWPDKMIEHELGLCTIPIDNPTNTVVGSLTIYGIIMNGFANDADEYLTIRQHIPSDLNQLPEYVRHGDIIDMLGDTTDRLVKLVSTRVGMDFTGIPDSVCDYMDFLLRSCMQCARPVYDDQKSNHYVFNFLDNYSYDDYYHGGYIHDALTNFLQHVADDMTVSELALALAFVYAFNNDPGNSDYSYIDYVSILDVEKRERDGIMRMTDNHIMRAVRDYPTEFIQQLIESMIDYNGLEYYDAYEEIRIIKDNHIPMKDEV